METLTAVQARPHTRLRITTEHPTQFIDLTDRIEQFVAERGVRFGIVNIHSLHTTAAIVVNEHEPLLLGDFSSLLTRTAPENSCYMHDDLEIRTVNMTPDERANGHAHCRALFLAASASMNVVDGRLERGCWQRVFLVELDGPREREVSVIVVS